MLDIRYIEEHEAEVRAMLTARRVEFDLDRVLELIQKRKRLIQDIDFLRATHNTHNASISKRKQQGIDVPNTDIEQGKEYANRTRDREDEQEKVLRELEELILYLPNIPHESVPAGESEADNVVRETRESWGEPRSFNFRPRPHWDIGEILNIIDQERSAKISGSRFVTTIGAGARLERALQNLMLDEARKRGYVEVNVPSMVLGAAMLGTGQLPKFSDEMYRLEGEDIKKLAKDVMQAKAKLGARLASPVIYEDSDWYPYLQRLIDITEEYEAQKAGGYWLIPTAEVPVTNLHAGEILGAEQLPLQYAAFTPCFRREAGAPGRDTRGMMRVHQFLKVELVKLVAAETSYDEHEALIRDAAHILELLELPYREVVLCTADLGFGAAKCVDLEVWLPSENNFREISSCSNYEAFQARRMNTRYRPAPGAKPAFVHTLNGSALAVGRTMIAILENYQNADGSVAIPKALVPYMDGQEKIT